MLLPRAAAPAAVKLRATPQKFRSFYTSEDGRVPAHIRRQLGEPRRAAARWRLDTDALIRDSVTHQARLSFEDGLPVGRLRAIAITTDGAVWAGGDEGLVRYQASGHAWERWQYF